MLITAFMRDEGSEPTTIEAELLDETVDAEGESLRALISDVTNTSLCDITVVSENVATIALHALHGVLKATEPGAANNRAVSARAWALAALQELAFYDVDGIDTSTYIDGGKVLGPEDPLPAINPTWVPIASDPGREAVDAIRNGTHYSDKPTAFYVDWPDA